MTAPGNAVSTAASPPQRLRIEGEGEPLLAPIPDMCTSRLIPACLAALAIFAATT